MELCDLALVSARIGSLKKSRLVKAGHTYFARAPKGTKKKRR